MSPCSRLRQRGSPPRSGQRRDGRALVAAHLQRRPRASRAFARLVSSDRHAYRGRVLGSLAVLLLQAPLVPGGAATPDPPAMATTGAQEWNLGGVLRIKRYDFLRWHPVQHHTSLRWSLVLQPIFLVEVEPLRPRWNRLVVSFASAPATASGMPGTASARLQLRLPGTGARLGLEQGLVGAYQSTAAPRQPGSLQSMRGAARVTFSMPF